MIQNFILFNDSNSNVEEGEIEEVQEEVKGYNQGSSMDQTSNGTYYIHFCQYVLSWLFIFYLMYYFISFYIHSRQKSTK